MILGDVRRPSGHPYAGWMDATLERIWGLAGNGESIELAVRPHLVETLLERWPPVGLERHDRPVGDVVVQRGLSDEWIIIPDREPSGDNPPLLAWDQLEQSITLFTVHRMVDVVPVHSAAIEWHGKVMVVPALSGGGKSTLSVAAHEAGATVLSDEYTLIDPATGLVTGWPRAVRILNDDGTADRRSIAVPSGPLPVGLVAAVSHSPGAGNDWAPLSPGEIVGTLLGHALCARERPDQSFDAALAVSRTARGVKGTRGDAADAVHDLLALME